MSRHRLHGTFLHAIRHAASVSATRRGELVVVGDGIASANATGRKQEPIHKYALTVVVRIVREQPVPLVLLLASAVPAASIRLCFPAENVFYMQYSFGNPFIMIRART